ncbi:hypothetical protein [Helicobacter suis]|uniref:hypothetical protein n=1 Tax=Helicobacter suis TaxID=104628 RepID=UPI0013D7020D|nr:hypothetical protein [Helicobacter suis]
MNGHYVVVEQLQKGQNELAFKTMYFEKGDLTKNPAFTPAMPQEHLNRPSYELGVKQASDVKAEQNPVRNPLKSQEFNNYNFIRRLKLRV